MLTLLLAAVLTAHAELPLPAYPDCGVDQTADACPSDFSTGWEWISWSKDWPEIRAAEQGVPSGMSLDRALRYTGGRWDVPIAVLDSGLYMGELSSKVLLNEGELPRPRNAAGEEVDDLDGNGIFNVFDYAEDARVDIAAGTDRWDDKLDPSDLIYTFSDGSDTDDNGYIDDIAGWDFFSDDNDPYPQLDTGYAGHGTGVAKTAGSEGGDGGRIGVCPNCPILPLRTGDTFITDGDRAGLAIAYATDRGVKSIGMAMGAVTHPQFTVEAIEYADRSGVTLVGAAADENSYHHNLPSLQAPILYVHTVRTDNVESTKVTSFTNFNNCNNFGPRVDIVVGLEDCATGSTAVTAGAIGMVVSAGRDAGLELSPDEVRALLRTTVDDVYLTDEDQVEARTYPSKPGFDAFYGYGRLNLGLAVERAFTGDIPPEVRLISPRWFSWALPGGPPVTIEGRVAAPRSSGVDWVVEIGRGEAPDNWTQVASGSGAVDGTLTELDVGTFGDVVYEDLRAEQDVVERFERAHEALITIRIVATDASGRSSEERTGLWVQHDPDLKPGFPIDFGGQSLEPPPVLWDFDDDGDLEIVQVTSSGEVHVLQHDGTELAGFPTHTDAHANFIGGVEDARAYKNGEVRTPTDGVVAAPGVGDLDGDGDPELVVATLRGRVHAWHHDGTAVDGWPRRIVGRLATEYRKGFGYDLGIGAAPTLADLDDDGDDEVILGAMDQRLYVWQGDGDAYFGYPIELCREGDTCGEAGFRILGSTSVADLDNDGDLDAVMGTNEVPSGAAGLAYIIDLKSATIWEGWPQLRDGLINQTILPVLGEGHPAAVGIADIDGDGQMELASNAMLGSADLIEVDGAQSLDISYVGQDFGPQTNVDAGAFVGMATNPAFGDLNLDGLPDFVVGGSTVDYLVSIPAFHYFDYQHAVGAWDSRTGSMFPGFPRQVDDVSFLVAPAIADVSGDGLPEVLYGSGGFFLYAWDVEGNIAPGWPHFSGGWFLGAPAVGDIDGDGYLDVVAGVREGLLFAWTTRGDASQDVQWASVHHDAQNTGNYHHPIPAQAGPPPVEEPDGGCSCASGGGPAFALLLLAPALLVRRRGRR